MRQTSMLARKCDRCNALYEHYIGATLFKKDDKANGLMLLDKDLQQKYYERKFYDLCPKCMAELNAFLHTYNAEVLDET